MLLIWCSFCFGKCKQAPVCRMYVQQSTRVDETMTFAELLQSFGHFEKKEVGSCESYPDLCCSGNSCSISHLVWYGRNTATRLM